MTDINMLPAKIFIKLEKTETGLKLFDIYDGISYFLINQVHLTLQCLNNH